MENRSSEKCDIILCQDMVEVKGNLAHRKLSRDYNARPIKASVCTCVEAGKRNFISLGSLRLPIYSDMSIRPTLGCLPASLGRTEREDSENEEPNVITLFFKPKRLVGSTSLSSSPVSSREKGRGLSLSHSHSHETQFISIRTATREAFLSWHKTLRGLLADCKIAKALEMVKRIEMAPLGQEKCIFRTQAQLEMKVLSSERLEKCMQSVLLLCPSSSSSLQRLQRVLALRRNLDNVLSRIREKRSVTLEEIAALLKEGNSTPPIDCDFDFKTLESCFSKRSVGYTVTVMSMQDMQRALFGAFHSTSTDSTNTHGTATSPAVDTATSTDATSTSSAAVAAVAAVACCGSDRFMKQKATSRVTFPKPSLATAIAVAFDSQPVVQTQDGLALSASANNVNLLCIKYDVFV